MQKTGKNQLIDHAGLLVHPFADDTGKDGNTHGMVIQVISHVVKSVQVVNNTALLGHWGKGILHQCLGFLHWNFSVVGSCLKNVVDLADNLPVFSRKGVAAVEYGHDRLIIRAELVLILDIDLRDIQKTEPGNVCLGQQGVLRKNDNHIIVDNGTG